LVADKVSTVEVERQAAGLGDPGGFVIAALVFIGTKDGVMLA
jgi:hypothetical protein